MTYTLHATGGYTSQVTSYTERRLPKAGDTILVTGPMQWDAPLPDGIRNIVLNSTTASWQIAPNAQNLVLRFGSTGTDAVGATCGGVVGNPGDCATMYGFTVLRAAAPCIDLTTPASNSPTLLTTVDGVSPIYFRYQPTAGCATLTIKNAIINNLGGDSSNAEAYSGIVFNPAANALNAKVDVENVQVMTYYRLFYGGPVASDANSVFKWYAVTSYKGRASTYGAITIISARPFRTTQVYDTTDSQPNVDGYYFYSFPVGTNFDIQRPFVAGNSYYKRGVYFNMGGTPGTGGNLVQDAFCLNFFGSIGRESCVYDGGTSQFGTNVNGLVATGNYQTIALRPSQATGSYLGATPDWTNFWIGEDGTVSTDQGAIFIGGGNPHAHHGVVVITGPGTYQMGVFGYFGAQPNWDHLTIVGVNAHNSTRQSMAMSFGETNYTIRNGHGHSNLIAGFDRGIMDCNSKTNCGGTTYLVDADVGSGVHHNNVWDFASGGDYYYSGGVGFMDAALDAHPSAVYGDSAVNPYLPDTSRTPFTFDRDSLAGDGTGNTLTAVAGNRWKLAVGSLNPAQAAMSYLLPGFTPPAGNAVCAGGYKGTQMGALPCK